MQCGTFINTNLALSQIVGRMQDAQAGDAVEMPFVVPSDLAGLFRARHDFFRRPYSCPQIGVEDFRE